MTVAPITNLDYVILLCGRLAETRAFYLETMRFPLEVEDRAEWVSFRVGSGLLTLRPRGPGLAWDDGPALAGFGRCPARFPGAAAGDHDWHAALIAKGVPILSPPRSFSAGAIERCSSATPRAISSSSTRRSE